MIHLSTIIFIVGLLGAVVGIKRPWFGGLAGLLIAPSLFYFAVSSNLIPLVVITLTGFILGLACGFAGSLLYAGLSGKGRAAGTTYISGFGVHHPGGIILTPGERKDLWKHDHQGGFVRSY